MTPARARAAALAELTSELGGTVRASTPVHGGCITDARRLELDNGSTIFAKLDDDAPAGFFAAEAAGLRWLRAADAVAVPEVLAVGDRFLALEWIAPGRRQPHTDEALGRGLALLHRAGAEHFGRPPAAPRWSFLGTLAVPDSSSSTWGEFWVESRVRPIAEVAIARGELPPEVRRSIDALAARVDEVAGPPEPPARVHGDLWSGNVHVDRTGTPWLVDPSAHGGHRETDLAMLALFGGVDLARVISAYEDVTPLADRWGARVALHQLVPLLAHVALFGKGYIAATREAFSAYVRPGW